MTFTSLGVIDPILRALQGLGYEQPTPIQEQAIPLLLQGKDLLGCAQTGTGKTAAFAIPIIQKIAEDRSQGPRLIRALILAPTRELAIQINESITSYRRHTGLRNTVIFGGVKQGPQTTILKRGVDILVATPGRLLDLIGQGFISLRDIDFFVLDEADHMLDMGFIHDIRKVVAQLPKERQSLFFSATMPPAILDLSRSILGQPEKITIKPQQATAELVDQSVYHVLKKTKRKLLLHLIREKNMKAVLVFSRTKHGANRIVKDLLKAKVEAAAIHGNKTQGARQRALKAFRDGEITVLVATDIAARGIDVSELPYVINFDLPNVPETYVHRIGRTGRAKASGVSISFCDIEERPYLKDIQKLIRQQIPVIVDHPFVPGEEEIEAARAAASAKKPVQNRGNRSRNNNRGRNNKRSSSGGGVSKDNERSSNGQRKRKDNDQSASGNGQSKRKADDRKSSGSSQRKDNDRSNSGNGQRKRKSKSNDRGSRGMWPLG